MIANEVAHEFDQCIKCGLCLATCPACKELLLEKYTPRGKVQLARYYSRGDLELSDQYRDIFAKCLLCGACNVTCPSGVDLKKVFLGMREEIAGKRGIHPMVAAAVKSLAETRNISGEENVERGDWKEALRGVPEEVFEKQKAEVVYFVGCVASFFPMVQSIPQNLVRILHGSGVDFTILGGEEWCCGVPLIGAGVPEEVQELRQHNLKKVKDLGAKTVVFSCPTCQRTWREFYGAETELLHTTQLVEKMIRDNPYAARVAAEGIVHVRPGRPRKGTETGPTEPRSIRFPAPVWRLFEARAKAKGLSLHSALRAAIIDWARRAP